MDGGRDGEHDNVIPHGSQHCFTDVLPMESMIMLFHMALNIVPPSQDTRDKIFHSDSFLSQGVSRQSRINVRND